VQAAASSSLRTKYYIDNLLTAGNTVLATLAAGWLVLRRRLLLPDFPAS
jgi:hypothetical protein